MTNKFYAPGEARAAQVSGLFAKIAPRYDLINDLQSFGLHRYWKRRLVRLAGARPGLRALDLCCGTGDVTFALARAGVDTVGLDFSEPMLAVARRRSATAASAASSKGEGRKEPVFLQGDAQEVPYPDASFDVVTISYGLRNLADFDRGLREMCRLVRPGGRLLVLDFGKPDNAVWRSCYFAYLRHVVPWLGWALCGDRDTHGYILESLLHYAAQAGVARKMRELGLEKVQVINLMGGMMSINVGVRPR